MVKIKTNQPNIVLITCDHLREDLLSCAGNRVVQTPHMDILADRGVRFTQAYSPTPICIPARATIMTGLEGHTHGLTEFKPGFELPVTETMPQQLSDAGYQTKVVGKMHTFPERRHYGFENMLLCEEGRLFGEHDGENRGYDDYEQWLADQGYPGKAFSHGMGINDYSVTPWNLPDHLHPTEWIGYQTCKEIKRRDWTRPQFIWASFTAPHPPLTPLMNDLYMYDRDEMPKPYIGDWVDDIPEFHQMSRFRYKNLNTDKKVDLARRSFFAMITQIDRQVNRIIGTLEQEGLLDNTWFIITSDHGDNLGDHHLWQKGNFLKGACNVPLIITPPLDKKYQRELLGEDWIPGTVSDAVVGLQDIMATCVDIAEAEFPEKIDGKSLLPIVKDQKEAVRDVLLGEFGVPGVRSLMVTDGNWKYIWYEEDGRELFFHIKEDPNELHNLAEKDHEMKDQLRSQLVDILSNREDDPAVEENQLKPAKPGQTLSQIERQKNFNYRRMHFNPTGLH